MSDGRICDNCRHASADHERWVMLLDGAQRTEPSGRSALLYGDSPRPLALDFCSWRCVQDYAVVKALESETSA